jgi:hypothetical protein
VVQDYALNMVAHGLDYIRNCFVEDPTDYGNPLGDVYVYQVGDIATEMASWRRPEDIKVLCNPCSAIVQTVYIF